MVSFIESNQRRGTIFLVIVGLALLLVFAQGLLFPHEAITDEAPFLFSYGTNLEAALAGSFFWIVLSFLTGLLWSRVLFGSVSFVEVFIVGSTLSIAAFPLLVATLSLVFKGLSSAGFMPEVIIDGWGSVYALLGVMVVLLLGGLALVGREVLRASRSNSALV